jgi:hypothetical protein
MRTRTILFVGLVLVASAVGSLRLTSLGKAASQPPTADDCRLFSCVFDDLGGDD